MKLKTLLSISMVSCCMVLNAQTRHWQARNGLSTGEVRQIIPLPNRQMLVNCEGVFCISNGAGFSNVPCDRRKTYLRNHYSDSVGYGHQWQGDSLLWLCDFYRIYLFDTRTRTFRYDIEGRLHSLGSFTPSPETVSDWQGGSWTRTLADGIIYTPPARRIATTADSNDSLATAARKAEVLDIEITPKRRLQRRGLNQIGYLLSEDGRFVSLNDKLPQLNKYRFIAGACLAQKPWVVLYTQNGACMLNTAADTLAAFKPSETIEEYTDKYNCMVRGQDGALWIGTQNGLFKTHAEKTERITGLANNCIRSLVRDAEGNIWAGTAHGITRITPSVINYGADDGIPPVPMMERAACLTADGRMVFVHHSSAATVFHPKWLSDDAAPRTPVLTALFINSQTAQTDRNARLASYAAASRPLSLSYDDNYLTFQFSSLDYARPSHVRYRYRICGLEEGWHTASETIGLAEADYKALPPGKYTFEAQAASADGEWSKALKVPITIRPPFWLTWWAKTLYALSLCSLVAFFVTLYLKKKKAALERENDNRVNQLFEMRDEARHQFANNTNIDPKKIGVNPEEEALVAKLLKAIEAHIADEDYSVEQLASDVALSRTTLYGILRNMLGISPAAFIRNVRLKRAAQLLTDSPSLSINEVSARVGFSTPRNFSAQFKKMFGVLPSEYKGTKSLSLKI